MTINDHFGDNDGDCADDGAGIVGDNGDGEGNEVDGKQEGCVSVGSIHAQT